MTKNAAPNDGFILLHIQTICDLKSNRWAGINVKDFNIGSSQDGISFHRTLDAIGSKLI